MEIYAAGRLIHFLMMPLWMSAFFAIENQMRMARQRGTVDDATSRSLKISRILMHVSMTLTLVGGLMMVGGNAALMSQGWFHAKLAVLAVMMAASGIMGVRSRNPDKIMQSQIVLHTLMGSGMVVVVVLAVLRPSWSGT